MEMEPPPWKPHVGQHVYIAGTGKWWTGQHFGAVVVDVRASDATVKVRYTDGGFKRFGAGELAALVTMHAGTPEMWEEWTASSMDDGQTELQRLHEQIMAAQRIKDQRWEAELSKRFDELAEQKDELDALQISLKDAVSCGDFLRAHDVQRRIRAVETRSPQTEVAAQADAVSDTATQAQATSSTASPDSVVARPAVEQDSHVSKVLHQALAKSLGGGLAGAGAMVAQVTTMMWLRTTMNYQYRYGMNTMQAMGTLHAEGGVMRFYRGYFAALLQSPLARFADTAANAGVMELFEQTEARDWPIAVKTVFASAVAASARIALIPLDTVKTVLQVEGRAGLQVIAAKYMHGGAPIFFHGALATSAATFVGHYPWFTTFNYLNEVLPNYGERHKQLMRHAVIGFSASVCSDTVANSLRVIKTVRQTQATISYQGIIRQIVKEDGVAGLFGRGLKTRILTNGLSGIMFSVLYKTFEERLRV